VGALRMDAFNFITPSSSLCLSYFNASDPNTYRPIFHFNVKNLLYISIFYLYFYPLHYLFITPPSLQVIQYYAAEAEQHEQQVKGAGSKLFADLGRLYYHGSAHLQRDFSKVCALHYHSCWQ
jgi:hypothetical protein